MKKVLTLLSAVALAMGVVIPSAAVAQVVPTAKVPLCLQVRDGTKTYIPCTGMVPIDPATGNVISWNQAFNSSDTANGQPSTTSTSIQNTDGTKVASDAQLVAAVAKMEEVRSALVAGLSVKQVGSTMTDRTVASLSAGQAAGTATVIAANPNRKVFSITPAADGRLYINSGGTGFYYPLYAGITRTLSGVDCPLNALYVTGQTAGVALPMAES